MAMPNRLTPLLRKKLAVTNEFLASYKRPKLVYGTIVLMEPEQLNNLKVAVIGPRGDGRVRPLKNVSDLEQLIAAETANMSAEDYASAVGTLYRCVNMIANSIASMPRQIESMATNQIVAQANFPQPELDENGRPLSEDNLPFKIKTNRLLYQTAVSLEVHAEAFWHKERNMLRQTAVTWQDPKLLRPKRDDYGIVGFEKRLRGRSPIPIPLEDIAYFYIPGLRENKPGVSPAQAALHDAGVIYHQNAFLSRFFENGAMPTTLFFMEGVPPSPDETNRIKRFLYSAMTGRLRAWGIELLSRNLHFEHLVPPLKEMVLPQLRTEAQHGICIAMGVPVSVLFSNASRNSTSEQDDLHFYTKTVVPLARDIEETANDEIFGPLGLRLRFRPEKLEVFEQQELSKLQGLAVVAADLSRDERRAAAGYPPDEGDDSDDRDTSDDSPDGMMPDSPSSDDSGADMKAAMPLGMTEAEYELMQRDLALWETKVLKRVGKVLPASIVFESDFIPAQVAGLVRSQLLYSQSAQEVKAAFAAPFRVFQRAAPPRFSRYGR